MMIFQFYCKENCMNGAALLLTHYNFFNNIFLWNSLCVLYSTATSVSFQWVLLILCYINALHFIHHPAQVIVGDSSVRNTSSFTHVSIIAYSTIMLLQFGADGNRNQKASRNVWLTPTVWGRRLTWMCDYYFILFVLCDIVDGTDSTS